MTGVCLTKEINRNLWNPLNPQIRITRISAARIWKKGADLQPTLKLSKASAVPEKWKETIKWPIAAFKAIFIDDLVLHVTNQTNLYVVHMVKTIWTCWSFIAVRQSSISNSLLGSCTLQIQWSSLMCKEQKKISRGTIKPSPGWQHTDYRRYILQSTSTIWKAEFQFQIVWFICLSQRWQKYYPLLWKIRHKKIY